MRELKKDRSIMKKLEEAEKHFSDPTTYKEIKFGDNERVNHFMHNIEKWPKNGHARSQDFQGVFCHFPTLCMKELN